MAGRETDLCDAFKSALSTDLAAGLPDDETLAGTLQSLMEKTRQRYPSVSVSVEEFLAHVAGRLHDETSIHDALDRLAAGDLLLAFACMNNDQKAWRILDEMLTCASGPVFSQYRLSGSDAEEILQGLRELLVLGRPGQPPLLASFRGKGDMQSWLRVILLRSARRQKKIQHRTVPLEDITITNVGLDRRDPELDFIKDQYIVALKESFRNALHSLPKKERNILRYYLIDGLNIGQIGAIFRVHRATVARWIVSIRESLLRETQRLMKRDLHVGGAEIESVIRLVQSRLDITFSALLTADEEHLD